jgi:hypothetical protein
MRRAGKASRNLVVNQDPGKDFFAFLFITLLIMVFVILMTYEQKSKSFKGAEPPVKDIPGSTSKNSVSPENIGRLTKSGMNVFIVFNNSKFNPLDSNDINRMIEKNFIKENKKKGKKELLLRDDPQNGVLLSDYFSAFSLLSQQGIDVIFGDIKQ